MADKTRILVAEDEDGYLDLLTVTLQSAGYEVIQADNGTKALEKASIEKPDLILTDVRMPGLDGYHFARAVSEGLLENDPPVIIMTSRETENPREKGAAVLAGAAALMQKPLDMKALLSKIEELLAERAQKP